jgi:hypothetical protein
VVEKTYLLRGRPGIGFIGQPNRIASCTVSKAKSGQIIAMMEELMINMLMLLIFLLLDYIIGGYH